VRSFDQDHDTPGNLRLGASAQDESMKLGLRNEEQTERLRTVAGTEPPVTTDSLVALARALRFASAEALMAQRIAHQRAA
jgi:hypothetical protein